MFNLKKRTKVTVTMVGGGVVQFFCKTASFKYTGNQLNGYEITDAPSRIFLKIDAIAAIEVKEVGIF